MKMTESTLQRFFKGECNAAEEARVREYLQQHPEVLVQHMTEDSWETTEEYELPGDLSDRMSRRIAADTYRRQPIRMRYQWAAAAAVVVLLAGGWLWQQAINSSKPTLAQTLIITQQQHTQTNNGDTVMAIQLADHSTVVLEGHSSLSYPVPFDANKRDVHLTGCATFTIAQRRDQPFTVYAAHTATTALGTVFRVNTHAKGGIQVHLYSGKVVVMPDNHTSSADSGLALYLRPGQEAICNNQGYASLVKPVEPVTTAQPITNVVASEAALRFTDEPLADIFNKLQKQRSIRIVYHATDLVNMSFTGTHNPAKETIEEFLETLTLLNGLHVEKQNNTYHITR